jgi:hypothetical protein
VVVDEVDVVDVSPTSSALDAVKDVGASATAEVEPEPEVEMEVEADVEAEAEAEAEVEAEVEEVEEIEEEEDAEEEEGEEMGEEAAVELEPDVRTGGVPAELLLPLPPTTWSLGANAAAAGCCAAGEASFATSATDAAGTTAAGKLWSSPSCPEPAAITIAGTGPPRPSVVSVVTVAAATLASTAWNGCFSDDGVAGAAATTAAAAAGAFGDIATAAAALPAAATVPAFCAFFSVAPMSAGGAPASPFVCTYDAAGSGCTGASSPWKWEASLLFRLDISPNPPMEICPYPQSRSRPVDDRDDSGDEGGRHARPRTSRSPARARDGRIGNLEKRMETRK